MGGTAALETMVEKPVAVERLVKSAERVRDLGEVFTPAATVDAMLDLLPAEMWIPYPSRTFLEPACGDGNFLVAILERKLQAIPAEQVDRSYAQVLSLAALSSIYAVDISVDNIVGGTPGHEVGARERMLNVYERWTIESLDVRLTKRSPVWKSAKWILEHNIQVGNMLAFDADGKPTGRDEMPLVEYSWEPEKAKVSVAETTLGAVMDAELDTLFGSAEPTPMWAGKAVQLHQAPVARPDVVVVTERNGRR